MKWHSCLIIVLGVWGFPAVSVVKNPLANEGDGGSIPELGRSPGEGNCNPLQHSCLENPMDRGAWQATVQRLSTHRSLLFEFHQSSYKGIVKKKQTLKWVAWSTWQSKIRGAGTEAINVNVLQHYKVSHPCFLRATFSRLQQLWLGCEP